ncbi:Alpha/beta hydrolase fold-1 [Dactylonectria estremocensis]|uniref:Alpha/beta hydrolase fold-1 n=1 Tax=Dactylonectria estremocensis TaxID=1079267 RepID=A0A9P9D1T5_9HYPO|nr:Alpha/beta hydrolase fold-1 [Dactylonectria estremocensis]
MSLEKPTILLLPGAWHRGSTFEPVAALLRRQGYPVETPTLLSAGGPTSTTVADDAAHIQKRYLTGLITQGKEVVVVMHSYSGIPGTDAVKGHTRKDVAAQGRKGGVVALVYMAAFLIPAGQSVDSSLPGGAASIMTFDGEKTYFTDPIPKFYNDLDEDMARNYAASLVYHAKPSFFTPLTYEAYHDVPSTYLFCEKDACFPLAVQQAMAAMPGDGVVQTRTCTGSHSAMLSVPQAVADVVQAAASDWKHRTAAIHGR